MKNLLCVCVGLLWEPLRLCGGVSVSFKRGSLVQWDRVDSCKVCCCDCA